MDNASVHRSSQIKDLLKTKENTLLHSVLYRPRTNAIVGWFSQFKYYLKLSRFVSF